MEVKGVVPKKRSLLKRIFPEGFLAFLIKNC